MTEGRLTGATVGVVAGVAGVAAALFVLFGPVVTVESQGTGGAVSRSTISGIDYLLGNPNAQVELLVWPLLLGAVSVVGALAAQRGHRAWTWSAAAAVAIFAVVGAMSIGLLFAPAALLMLVAAAMLE